jgi:hypothetical protein
MVAGGREASSNRPQSFQARKVPFDIDALLHPSRAFRHLLDVVRDADMTVAEKRSVLASWASDACAIESNPALRAPATGNVVNYDDIIDALQSLIDGGGCNDRFNRIGDRLHLGSCRRGRVHRDVLRRQSPAILSHDILLPPAEVFRQNH